MILLLLLGIIVYFVLPLVISLWLLERNDYRIFGWDVDVVLVGWGIVLIELALFIQIIVWWVF